MKNKITYILICIVIFVVGLGCGVLIGLNVNKVENANLPQTNKEQETAKAYSLKDIMSEAEFEKLKSTVEKDEADYGNSYQELKGFEYTIKREPDRIYFKSSKADGFYCFEKTDENYAHALEVIEDRMTYSTFEDYNLYCFTPDSIATMMTSDDNYVVYDYDNGDLNEMDEDFQKDIIFRFSERTRLYRLLTYLSYPKDMILKENLGKEEFASDTTLSGYKYMTFIEGD